tara:strand:+ start:7932 stop:8039 length:108 start_codon:yes stop_codon:yes gene_type:complete
MHVRKPYKLSDEDWATQILNLHFIRKQEEEASKKS